MRFERSVLGIGAIINSGYSYNILILQIGDIRNHYDAGMMRVYTNSL